MTIPNPPVALAGIVRGLYGVMAAEGVRRDHRLRYALGQAPDKGVPEP